MATATLVRAGSSVRLESLGLKIGQRYPSTEVFYRSGYWYDETGTVLGWGDLSPSDFRNIASVLKIGQLIFVAPPIGRPQVGTQIRMENLLGSSPFVIGANEFFFISTATETIRNPYVYRGIAFRLLTPEQARDTLRIMEDA